MAEIILFRPQYEFDVEKNLHDFIEFSRNKIFVFGADLDFDSNVWNLTDTVNRKGMGGKNERFIFNRMKESEIESPLWMSSPFIGFAKAYLRYSFGLKPTKNLGRLLSALRFIEFALVEICGNSDPTKITATILNRAMQLAVNHNTDKVAYQIGNELRKLSKFMTENKLLTTPTLWRNPIKKPFDSVRIGAEFDKRRAEKVPSNTALKALADIFHHAQHPADILISAAACILLSAPSRSTELIYLPENCEVHETLQDGTSVYGLRWWPAKDASPTVKYVVSPMVEPAQLAIQKIRSLTAPAREIAAWYEKNPDKVYLPKPLEHLRNTKWLEPDVLVRLFSLRDRAAARDWCVARKIKRYPDSTGWRILFSDFEQSIISLLPRNFPIYDRDTGLKYCEALMIVCLNELHDVRSTNPCMFEPLSTNCINYGLGGRVEHGGASIFTRNNWTEDDGSYIKITTHQFRHLLNTVALTGNMDPLILALFSGRKDVKQSAAYDHQTSGSILQQIRDSVGNTPIMYSPLGEVPENLPVTRGEYAILQVPTAHTTDLGYCIHDYTMEPCPLHNACIHCEELVCIKGDSQKNLQIKQNLDEALFLLSKAEKAVANSYAGSQLWLERHKSTVERLQELWGFIADPRVPIGAVIQLRKPQARRISGVPASLPTSR